MVLRVEENNVEHAELVVASELLLKIVEFVELVLNRVRKFPNLMLIL